MRYTKLGLIDEVFNVASVALGLTCLGVIGTYTYQSYGDNAPDIRSSKKIAVTIIQDNKIVIKNGMITLERPLDDQFDLKELYYVELSTYIDYVCNSGQFTRNGCVRVTEWKPTIPNEKTIRLGKDTHKVEILDIKGNTVRTSEGTYKLKTKLPLYTPEQNVFVTHLVLDDFMCIADGYMTKISQCSEIASFSSRRNK